MATRDASAQVNLLRAIRIVSNFIILALWLFLYRAVFDYFAVVFTREDFRTNQIVLIGVLALMVLRARQDHWSIKLDRLPQFNAPAFGLVLLGSILYLVVERWIAIRTISASMFVFASYGLLGLWMHPRRWRAGLVAALVVVGMLPFGDHMQTVIGYPMRILTAAMVRDGLAMTGVASMGVDTILILENGVSQIDLPCSGVKSLWTGALFLLAATWVERRALNRCWMLVAVLFSGMLFITNFARIGILVVVGQVVGSRLLAEIVHIPLGVLGFVVACAVGLGLLRWIDPYPDSDLDNQEPSPTPPGAPWFSPALVCIILGMGLVYAPRPQTGLAELPPAWEFPAELVIQPMSLKPDEIELLTRDGADSAERFRFDWHGKTGSMILITSRTWQAHHQPERCFTVYGLAVNDTHTVLPAFDFPVRLVSLSDETRPDSLSAAYWFQSADRVTEDYSERIWQDLWSSHQRWVLVSILFDNTRDPSTPDAQSLYFSLRDAITKNLEHRRYLE